MELSVAAFLASWHDLRKVNTKELKICVLCSIFVLCLCLAVDAPTLDAAHARTVTVTVKSHPLASTDEN